MLLKRHMFILCIFSTVFIIVVIMTNCRIGSDCHRRTMQSFDRPPSTEDKHYGIRKLLRKNKDGLHIEEHSRDLNNSDFNETSAEKLEAKAIRSKLSRRIAVVEDEVLNMNVKLVLRTLSDVPLKDNRLIHKIQQAQRHPEKECVIRIAKYCAERCDHYVGGIHSRKWERFHCAFAKPCKVETRFVGNLTTEIMQSSDVLFIISSLHKGLRMNQLLGSRPPGQLWILSSRESPLHDVEYAPQGLTGNPFNLSMTYAKETDIHVPYCLLQEHQTRPPPLPKKTKLMAWMASNCHLLSWRRGEFVQELKKYLPVDTYGRCGNLGSLSAEQANILLPQYKFYLALENSECRDYITEKLWKTSLLQGVVPVVYGAKRENYERLLPKNSFIYIEDFSNMSSFVDHIHALDVDEARYNKYSEWRRNGEVICFSYRSLSIFSPEINFCYFLRKLIQLSIHPETSWQKKTPDFASWWKGQCLDPSIERRVLGFNVHQKKKRS